jgi:hypothetical protein
MGPLHSSICSYGASSCDSVLEEALFWDFLGYHHSLAMERRPPYAFLIKEQLWAERSVLAC